MSQYIPQISSQSLQEKVVLITGGANGIGASLVQQCLESGANVCFGDLDNIAGDRLLRHCQQKFPTEESNQSPRAVFQTTDVTNYQSVLALFDYGFKTYKRIDHVVSAAGIVEIGNWFDFGLTLQTVRETPTHKVLDVNLLGSTYVARIASVYLRHNRGPSVDRSILLFSCASGFKESPSLFIYQASKHGVIGLMRSLRNYISSPYKHNLRINTICPWMTETDAIRKIEDQWKQANLPTNTPRDVSSVAAGILADQSLNGTSMFVESGRAWEIEENIDRLEAEWLGEQSSKTLAAGQEFLDDGSIWTALPRKKSSISNGIPPGVSLEKINGMQDHVQKMRINGVTNGHSNGVANGVH
ncbi:Short-chain dehydrogenase/reductase SDR [Penicillium citrinum]|jgi:NAD(P)-dependent dehydrogenase (short-subunit alcohol dehydrogenase family)|uniref:Short-chain dehydrogenase/reductase SDR n=1 Tax=Penicillium citrinum TaxID=5077 RepID=A0A9W9TMT8_PENCI|nr:Short-chain dehydrogenase/reductase SDR [Penicillium citrinum]KAJ5231938.1 Short-chain dehydrogenase/reductase SDR [Penicillium citrinum]